MLLLGAALAPIAYKASFSVVNLADDDGYVIVSLRLFEQGGALYSDVYSHYGPGLFTFVGGFLHLAGIDLLTDGSHWINIGFWIASTMLAGVTVLRLTRSFPVALAGLVVTFLVLQADANEPLHPGAMIGFLLIAIVAAAAFLHPARPRAAMAVIGALAMAIVSVKVNVGGLALASILCACALATPLLADRRWVRIAAAVLLVALPFALLAGHLDDPDTLRFAIVVATGAAGAALVGLVLPGGPHPGPSELRWLGLGALAVLIVVVAVPLATGTSPGDLIDGWVIRPAGTPGIQFAPLGLDPLGLVWAAAGLAGAVICARRLRSRAPDGGTGVRPALGIARIALGVIVLVTLADGPVFDPLDDLWRPLAIAGPFAWVVAVPPAGAPLRAPFVRLLIALLAVLQPLHAFPVPGTQLAWGQLLFVVVGCLCIADGVAELVATQAAQRTARRGLQGAGLAAVVGFVVWAGLGPLKTYRDGADYAYGARVPLGLPGAGRVHAAPDQVENLRMLTAVLQRNCSTFLTLPGLNSLYLYSGEQPPTVLSGPWTFFLTADDQQAIVDKVEGIDRLCVVRNPELQGFWAGFSGPVPQRPLVRFIDEQFEQAGEFSGYQVLLRKRGPGS